MIACDVKRLTSGPSHHLFGFHDLVQSNAKGDLALSLEIDDISRPPLPGETCRSGIVSSDGIFHMINVTHTWNYPQGARQQWLGASDLFSCNDRDENGNVFAWICDARKGMPIQRLDFPVHCFEHKTQKSVYINYDRLHAVGGYGYVPNIKRKSVKIDDLPSDDGLWLGSVKTGQYALLASILEVASCGEKKKVNSGYPHYLTHPMLNPKGNRVAFLHRYRVSDGGEVTRLMTIGLEGQELRCLAKGFLSHFTWIGNDEIFIWGAHQPSLYALREMSYLRIPGVAFSVKIAKQAYRGVRGFFRHNHKRIVNKGMSFLSIKDSDVEERVNVAGGVLVEDGHPMARPFKMTCLVNDTYPNHFGERTLMLYDTVSNKRQDIGVYKMLHDKPDLTTYDWRAAQSGTDPRILKKFNKDLYMFARSGLHCDLHPRWSWNGNKIYFDSIHEGSRQIYVANMEGKS